VAAATRLRLNEHATRLLKRAPHGTTGTKKADHPEGILTETLSARDELAAGRQDNTMVIVVVEETGIDYARHEATETVTNGEARIEDMTEAAVIETTVLTDAGGKAFIATRGQAGTETTFEAATRAETIPTEIVWTRGKITRRMNMWDPVGDVRDKISREESRARKTAPQETIGI
jgi:hypothetical protein